MSSTTHSPATTLASYPVHQLARQLSATIEGDPSRTITSAVSLGTATISDVSFLTAAAAEKDIASGCPGAVIVDESHLAVAREQFPDASRLVVEDAQAAFLEVLALFHPPVVRPQVGISSRATIGSGFSSGNNTNVYAGACVGDRVRLGDDCDIHPGVVIGDDCHIGDQVIIYPGAVLYPGTRIADRVIIHANAVIGADGFGYRFTPTDQAPAGAFHKIIHYGHVVLEDDVEIGAGTTIDRAMLDATVIGHGTKIDDQVMVGHNCQVGPHNAFASQVGIAGSTTTGSYVRCGGQVGIADHLTIGDGASVAAKAAVARDIPAGETQLGYPAGPESQQLRILIAQQRLPELLKTVKALVQRIDRLESELEARDATPLGESNDACRTGERTTAATERPHAA